MWASGHDETVEVNQRALIDKVLARYSGEFTVFRELLQNSDDAKAKEVEIRFETKEFRDRNAEGASSEQHEPASVGLPDLRTTPVHHWNFRNNGIVFRDEDWNRLRKIAEGNPDEEKIGAFGVGFYSLFSVTEEPFVSSGDQWMGFHWKDNKDQLLARRGPMPATSPPDPWTTFNMPLRDPASIPPPFDLTRFLASSITFMVNVEAISIYFNDKCLSKLSKSVGLPKLLSIAPANAHLHKKRASEKGLMHVGGIAQTTLYIEAKVMTWVYLSGTEKKPPPPKLATKPAAPKPGGFFSSLFGFSTPQRGNAPLPVVAPKEEEKPLNPNDVINTSISLSIYSADVDVKLDNKTLNELQRSTKKRPPTKMKCALIYTGKNEYDSSTEEDKRLPFKTGSVFQGLRADIDGTGHAKIFIGHATGQTTGIGGHVSGRFIPTVERESIDLMDRTVAVWNRELLWVTGYLSRCAYELELAHVRTLWEGAMSPDTRIPPPEIQIQLSASALHTLKFFTFNASTPSSDVSYLIQTAFFSCAPPDLPLMTSAGVRSASTVRMPDAAFSGFLKHLPVVPQDTIENAGTMVAYLREKGVVKETTFKDVLDELSARPLTEAEMVACLTWWCGLTRQGGPHPSPELLRVRTQLINAALLLSPSTVGDATEKVIPLSIITAFINKKGSSGAHIPATGVLPDYVLPFSISHHFPAETLTTAMPWRELTVVDWLSHIASPAGAVDVEHNITLSPVFAEEVLLILSRSLPSLPAKSQPEIKAILKDKPCMPTTAGMMMPGSAYFPNVDIFKDLPVVKLPSNVVIRGNLDRLLEMLGVRKHVELQMVFNKIKTGDWTINDLVKYLVSVQATLTEEELRRLKLTSAFVAEGEHTTDDGKTMRFQPQELYEPCDSMRHLGLPVIAWGTQTRWRGTSDEARFLFKLGLRRYPPLKTVIGLCASGKEELRAHALKFLLDNLSVHYSDYRPSDFATVSYVPAAKDGKECMTTPKEVYSSPEWALMGFCIVSPTSPHPDLGTKLRLQKHPSPDAVISLLRRQPPRDETQAKQWFEVLAGRIPDLDTKHLQTLSEIPFVPTRVSKDGALRYLPPSHCFFGSTVRTGLHSQLFVFVDFGPSAGAWLAACGTKNEPSVEEIVQILLADPHKFYDMANGAESFLNELRNIAVNSRALSSSTLTRLKRGSVLLGMRRKPTGKPAADIDEETWEMQYDLKRADQIIVADDTSSYHLFGENFFAAPQDDLLENFYLQLGSKRLSSLVKEKYNTSVELKDAKKSLDTRELILERLPLFLHEHSHGEQTRIKFEWLNSQENFSVKTFGKLEVEKSLTHDELRLYKKQEASAVASKTRTGSLQLWLAGHSQIDMYEVAVALCRYLFAAPKPNDALLLMTILSTDLKSLKRRGYNVDRILRKQSAQRQAAEEQAKKHQEALVSRPIPAMSSKETAPVPPPQPPAPIPAAAPPVPSKGGNAPQDPGPIIDQQRRPAHGIFNKIQDRLQSVMNKPSTGGAPPPRNPTVTPLDNIASNINMAISACRPEQSNLIRNREQMQMVKESLNEGYCDISGRGGDMLYIGMSGAYRFYVSKSAPQPETLLTEKRAVLACFNEIIQRLQVVFQLEPKSLHIFYDLGGDLIAFNRNASLFLNLRYFEEWHFQDVSNDDPSSALISWYFTLAHEIAHNLVQPHNSEHEFYFSAICEKYIIGLGQLLGSSSRS